MFSFHKGLFRRFLRVFIAVILLALAACQTAKQTAVPTQAIPGYLQPEQTNPANMETGPAPEQQAAGTPPGSYPAPTVSEPESPLTGKVQARQNLSHIKAELIETAPYEKNQAMTRVRARLLTSQPAEGMPSMTDGMVNQEVDLLVETVKLPDIKPGDTFEAQVSLLGDERGSHLTILQFIPKSD